ncbi:membrane protein [Microbacterium phage DelaGarza]|nr:membrane protein [Microbacterium phage DelaGarza]
MSDGGMTPSQFQILREDLAQMRVEWNQRFDNLVTRDTFSDERRRVDSRFEGQGREIAALQKDLAAEHQARVTAETNALQAQIAERNEREKVRRATQWQWLLIFASPVAAIIVGILAAQAGLGGTP